MTRSVKFLLRTAVLVLVAILLAALAPLALGKEGLDLEASIERRDVSDSSDSNPIVLEPKDLPVMRVRVENNSNVTITVRTVRLEGNVMGLTFFAYDTSVGMRIRPGETEERRFEMDLVGLSGQAVGLIPSSVEILDPDREVLASQSLVVDVRGSLRSVYGIFGLALVALTLASAAVALVKLARHTLPANRWKRAMRFATPGLGAGLVAVFTLSALRIFAPSTDKWIPLLAGGALIGFLLGYVTPSPEIEEEEEEEEEDEEEMPGAEPRPTYPQTERLPASHLPASPPPERQPTLDAPSPERAGTTESPPPENRP